MPTYVYLVSDRTRDGWHPVSAHRRLANAKASIRVKTGTTIDWRPFTPDDEPEPVLVEAYYHGLLIARVQRLPLEP